ncbi:protein of unknown function [Shewanella benthica]|uniref:Uncharacterized protein n=1 Tax=Shewanella benthica TaxID=43661 RepID=A0A330LWG6_9GAMM|nr:protein of unknown function [Shewanella benthica]
MILLHTGIGIAMVFAYKRFLTELDEMEENIQLDEIGPKPTWPTSWKFPSKPSMP